MINNACAARATAGFCALSVGESKYTRDFFDIAKRRVRDVRLSFFFFRTSELVIYPKRKFIKYEATLIAMSFIGTERYGDVTCVSLDHRNFGVCMCKVRINEFNSTFWKAA